MLASLSLVSLLLTLLILWVMGYGYLAKGYPLLSWRNFFLLGFLQFYTVTVMIMAPSEFPSEIYVPRGDGYPKLLLSMPLFLFLFFACARWAAKWSWPDRVIPNITLPVTTGGVLLVALIFGGLVAISVPLGGGSFGELLAVFLRTAVSSTAAGLAFYLVMKVPRNPFYWGLFGVLLMLAVVTAIVGSIDRRNFLSAFFVVPWMFYYFKLRTQRPIKTIMQLAAIGAVVGFCLIVYNSGRQYKSYEQASFSGRLNQLKELASNPDFSHRNVFTQLVYQDTPLNTLALMELYPERYDFDPLQGAAFFIANPIPRAIFPSKPRAVGIILQEQLDVAANLGVGVIGHGWYEAGWIGIIYYAIAFGFLISIVDRLIVSRLDNPYFICAIGANMGNVLGLARGETSMFLDMIIGGFIACTIMFALIRQFLKPYMLLGKDISPTPTDLVHDEPEEVEAFHDDPTYGDLTQPAWSSAAGAPASVQA